MGDDHIEGMDQMVVVGPSELLYPLVVLWLLGADGFHVPNTIDKMFIVPHTVDIVPRGCQPTGRAY